MGYFSVLRGPIIMRGGCQKLFISLNSFSFIVSLYYVCKKRMRSVTCTIFFLAVCIIGRSLFIA